MDTVHAAISLMEKVFYPSRNAMLLGTSGTEGSLMADCSIIIGGLRV